MPVLLAVFAATAGLGLLGVGLPPAAAHALAAPKFTQCPAIGLDTGCALLITVPSSGSPTVAEDTNQNSYSGFTDTLVGVQNNSSTPLAALNISSTVLKIFNFHGYGICTFATGGVHVDSYNGSWDGYCGAQQLAGADPYDYEGPDNTFADVSPSKKSGSVVFNTPLAPGGSAYFSFTDQVSGVSTFPITVQLPLSIDTSLSGGGQSGSSISVPPGTQVTDQALLTGPNAGSATGTLTYEVYSDNCTVLVYKSPAEPIGVPSPPVTLTAPGTYSWVVSYSGDSSHPPVVTSCGLEEETVLALKMLVVNTSLSGGGQSGMDITVPPGTAVTDQATLSGTGASSATGTVTYDVYHNKTCTKLSQAGAPETIVTPGTLPASAPVAIGTPGKYYWVASYSGDATHDAAMSPCGAEVETLTSDAIRSSLSGGGQSGRDITVPSGTAVTDQATLSGTDVSTATGTVTYNVYSNDTCTTLYQAGAPETIVTPGVLPASAPVTISTSGTYYWVASYSGDATLGPAAGACGAEVETVS